MELVPLGLLNMKMKQEVVMRGTPAGSRVVVAFSGIHWTGERVTASQVGVAAGDWLTVGPEGTAILDIRFCVQTPDGALIYARGIGRADSATFNEGSPLYFSPYFETNHPDYAWLNRIAAVAKGLVEGDEVTFELSQVA
jgi:hypothetical protein